MKMITYVPVIPWLFRDMPLYKANALEINSIL